jgi:hypothetical protein
MDAAAFVVVLEVARAGLDAPKRQLEWAWSNTSLRGGTLGSAPAMQACGVGAEPLVRMPWGDC